MTREEAIAELNTFKIGAKSELGENALDMAIKALQQEPCEDEVSRQAVLNAIEKAQYSRDFCKEHHIDYSISMEMVRIVLHDLPPVTPAEKVRRWIPVSERLPKENEYIGNVCKYYLIQDEYGDMHVAHLSNVGWIPMDSLKAIGDEIIAWQELPQTYVPEINVGKMVESEGKE